MEDQAIKDHLACLANPEKKEQKENMETWVPQA